MRRNSKVVLHLSIPARPPVHYRPSSTDLLRLFPTSRVAPVVTEMRERGLAFGDVSESISQADTHPGGAR